MQHNHEKAVESWRERVGFVKALWRSCDLEQRFEELKWAFIACGRLMLSKELSSSGQRMYNHRSVVFRTMILHIEMLFC